MAGHQVLSKAFGMGFLLFYAGVLWSQEKKGEDENENKDEVDAFM